MLDYSSLMISNLNHKSSTFLFFIVII